MAPGAFSFGSTERWDRYGVTPIAYSPPNTWHFSSDARFFLPEMRSASDHEQSFEPNFLGIHIHTVDFFVSNRCIAVCA